jgi:phage terminase large subunit-like protein
MSWPRYLDGAAGRAAFRRERLRLRGGRSLADAFERDPWQREHFAIFDDPAVGLAFIEATRGFGKTTEAGALSVERIVLREDHDVLVIANDRDQARILSREASGFLQRDSMLSTICDVQADRILNRQNGSLLVLSADAITNYGFGARSFTAIFDEFWAQPDKDLFYAIWTAVPKTPGSQVLILTNAGPALDGAAWEVRELVRSASDPAVSELKTVPPDLTTFLTHVSLGEYRV